MALSWDDWVKKRGEVEVDDAQGYPVSSTDIAYFDHIKGEMRGGQKVKARRFVDDDLIIYVGAGIFKCLPIEGYNTREYKLEKKSGVWSCNCQYYKKNHLACSHIQALALFFKEQGVKYEASEGNGTGPE